MNRPLRCIMLIDDDEDDNFFHQREINKLRPDITVVVMQSAEAALEYLKLTSITDPAYPSLFFLDINMPRMNGWDFMTKYNTLDIPFNPRVICVMLSTSNSHADKERAKTYDSISDFMIKPLTIEKLQAVIQRYFPL